MLTEWEKKALPVAMVAIVLAVLLYLISIGTTYWVILTIPGGEWREESQAYLLSHHSGLWRICRKEFTNTTSVVEREYCRMIKLFPSEQEIQENPEIDREILNYSRSETAFAMISLLLMLLGGVFSVYAYREPRYMFKRLVAALHFITAGCIFVSIEVLRNSVEYERDHLPSRHPKGSHIKYGFSFALAWCTFALYIIAGIIYLVFSAKRKGRYALTEREAEENEPVHLGR